MAASFLFLFLDADAAAVPEVEESAGSRTAGPICGEACGLGVAVWLLLVLVLVLVLWLWLREASVPGRRLKRDMRSIPATTTTTTTTTTTRGLPCASGRIVGRLLWV